MGELGFPQTCYILIGEDNHACIAIAATGCTSRPSKHVDIRFQFVRGAHRDKDIKVYYQSRSSMLADTITKLVNNSQFHALATQVMNII